VRHLPLFALLGWAVAIFVVSSFPNPPDAGGGEWKYEVAHVIEYLVFGALAFGALRTYLSAQPVAVVVLAAWAVSVLYGMSDELHQSFVPNRDSNWLDVGLDAVGGGIGVAVAAWFRDRGFGRATGRG
jgi:VanZ family protein